MYMFLINVNCSAKQIINTYDIRPDRMQHYFLSYKENYEQWLSNVTGCEISTSCIVPHK